MSDQDNPTKLPIIEVYKLKPTLKAWLLGRRYLAATRARLAISSSVGLAHGWTAAQAGRRGVAAVRRRNPVRTIDPNP